MKKEHGIRCGHCKEKLRISGGYVELEPHMWKCSECGYQSFYSQGSLKLDEEEAQGFAVIAPRGVNQPLHLMSHRPKWAVPYLSKWENPNYNPSCSASRREIIKRAVAAPDENLLAASKTFGQGHFYCD
jgi:hypothetical protein